MAASEPYRRQGALLIRILPLVAEEPVFALKGGTAINFFIRDLPRLSVDLDLTYLPLTGRPESLAQIDAAMRRIAARIRAALPGTHVHEAKLETEEAVNKLIARADDVQVKIEVTPVARGCVYEPHRQTVSPRVEEAFGFAEMQLVSFADLYAGKMVAALDRQHPRDLFDIRDLLATEGIDDRLRTAFVVYMLSHNRPLAEVLAPTRKDIAQEFDRGFRGMTETPVTLDELVETRDRLIARNRRPHAAGAQRAPGVLQGRRARLVADRRAACGQPSGRQVASGQLEHARRGSAGRAAGEAQSRVGVTGSPRTETRGEVFSPRRVACRDHPRPIRDVERARSAKRGSPASARPTPPGRREPRVASPL